MQEQKKEDEIQANLKVQQSLHADTKKELEKKAEKEAIL